MVVTAIVLPAPGASADPPRWSFFDIGALFNTAEAFWPYGVNDLGQVTGTGKQGFTLGSPEGPFITQPNSQVNWSPRPGNPALFVDQVVTGTYNNDPPGASPDNTLVPRPIAINGNAIVTGIGASYPHAMAFLGSLDLTTAIGPVGEVCSGYAINDANVVAGVKAVSFYTHAVRIAGGVTTDLGTFGTQPPDPNNDRSEALAVNAAGVIVGSARTDAFVPGLGTNETHAFRWTEGGGLVDLGTAGGPVSVAHDISGGGAVTGYAYDPGYNQVAVTWSPANAISIIPNGAQTYPRVGRWINDAGWVVGTAHIVPTGAGYFLHHEGVTYDLATLIDDDGTHWTNLVLTDMNNSGQIVGYGTNDLTPAGARRVFLLSPSFPTPTTLALARAEATTERVLLRWDGAPEGLRAALERRQPDQEWSHLAEVRSDGTGLIRYEDAAIVPGERYGYRLAVAGEGGTEYLGEAWVDVPHGLALAIQGFRPNPSAGAPTVSFALPSAGPARLELVDVLGRRVVTREWASLSGGAHAIALEGGERLRPGVYVVRLTFAGRTVARNGVILEP
jgi:probable HAF family extracellular repeat protein